MMSSESEIARQFLLQLTFKEGIFGPVTMCLRKRPAIGPYRGYVPCESM